MGAEVDVVSTVVTATINNKNPTAMETSPTVETTPSESPQRDSTSTSTATPVPTSASNNHNNDNNSNDNNIITTTSPVISTTTTTAAPTPLNDLTSNNKSMTTVGETPSKKKQITIKGKFPIAMTPTGRQDVIALKQRLADALGENGPLYWDALKDFVAGKLNRQEFDFYANLYLSQENAYLHNAFILSTVHNAQTATPPPSKHRSVGWAKRKRGKDNGLLDGDSDRDPLKKKLKMDVMSLSKSERDRLKALVKIGDKDKLKPFVDKLLNPRISRVPPLPLPAEQLPPTFNSDYARGLLAPLCSDLKELPGPETLHARMTSIALEQGLVKGVTEEVVSAMLFATESYIKSAIANTISKRRINRSIGLQMEKDTPETRSAAIEQILSTQPLKLPNSSQNQILSSSSSPSSSPSKEGIAAKGTPITTAPEAPLKDNTKTTMTTAKKGKVDTTDNYNNINDNGNVNNQEEPQSSSLFESIEDNDNESIKSDNSSSSDNSIISSSSSSSSGSKNNDSPSPNNIVNNDNDNNDNNDIASLSSSSSLATPTDSISLHDLAFSFSVSPYVLVENPLNAERLTALLTDSEDELTDDELGDTSSEGDFDL